MNERSNRKLCNTVDTTLMVPQEDLWIRTAWRSAAEDRRSLSTGGKQEGICGDVAMNFIDIFLTEPVSLHMSVCVCVCIWGKKWVSETLTIDTSPLCCQSHINCISAAAFHASELQHIWMLLQVIPWLFHKPQWEKNLVILFWCRSSFNPVYLNTHPCN